MIREIEEMAMNAWPSFQTKLYDGWVLRFADGFTKRANCVNPIYDSTMPLDNKIDYCENEYMMRNLPTIFKLNSESVPEGIDARLEEMGYSRDDEVSLRVLQSSEYLRREPMNLLVDSFFSDSWLDSFLRFSNITNLKDRVSTKRILANIFGPVVCVTKQIEGVIVGCGYGAIERDYVGIFNIVVDENLRGNGYGRDIMDGILGSSFRTNARAAYLQVLSGNVPAEKLYDKMGFREMYRYWYRKQVVDL